MSENRDAIERVLARRAAQDAKWGPNPRGLPLATWFLILAEEIGEFADTLDASHVGEAKNLSGHMRLLGYHARQLLINGCSSDRQRVGEFDLTDQDRLIDELTDVAATSLAMLDDLLRSGQEAA